jgi:hypothetical protein
MSSENIILTSKRLITPPEEVYNIEVKDNHNYLANGILVHNCDESALIEDEVFRTKIMRMLGDSDDSKLIQIGNAIKMNHFRDSWNDPNYFKIKISWEQCVKEGRLTQTFIDEQKYLLTPDEFKMWYSAEFVENPEDTLIRNEWIQNAINKKIEGKREKIHIGADIASGGMDFTVVTVVEETEEGKYKVLEIHKKDYADTMKTAEFIISIVEKYQDNSPIIKVDACGVGKGVYDRIKEQKYNVKGIVGGSSPNRETKRFLNVKAQNYFNLRRLFEEGIISIPNNPELYTQLRKMTYEKTIGDKIKIIDPEDKSPDFSDSLNLAVSEPSGGTISVFTKGLSLPK